MSKSFHLFSNFVLPAGAYFLFAGFLPGHQFNANLGGWGPSKTFFGNSTGASSSSESASNGLLSVDTSQISAMIKTTLQAEHDANVAGIDQGLADLNGLAKPQPGADSKANRLNQAGNKALKGKNFSAAVKLYAQAASINPAMPKYFSNLGFAEMYAGDLASGEKHTYISLALDPTRAVAWDNLGQIFAKKGNQDDAVTCFLLAYRISKGKTLSYLKSLDADEDQVIRNAGQAALAKIANGSDQPALNPTPDVRESQAPTPLAVPQVDSPSLDSTPRSGVAASAARAPGPAQAPISVWADSAVNRRGTPAPALAPSRAGQGSDSGADSASTSSGLPSDVPSSDNNK